MKKDLALFLVCAALLAFVLSGLARPASAAVPPVAVVEAAASGATAAGPLFVDSFPIICTSAAAVPIVSPLGGQQSYTCQNNTTTKVAVGDSGINDPTGTQNSPMYCASNCAESAWGGNIIKEFCRGGGADVTVFCRATIIATVAP